MDFNDAQRRHVESLFTEWEREIANS